MNQENNANNMNKKRNFNKIIKKQQLIKSVWAAKAALV